MADNAVRVYVRYERLYLAEFRALLRDLERAYNRLDSLAADSERIRRKRRLTIDQIQTGHSIEAFLLGSISGIGLLYQVVSRVIKLRHQHWAAEEQKWKALELRSRVKESEAKLLQDQELPAIALDGQRRLAASPEDERFLKAEEILAERARKIQYSRSIESVEIEIGDPIKLKDRSREDR